MVALQKHYNLVHRDEYEGDLARVATQLDVGVLPRFALAAGFLTGKYRTRSDLERERRGEEASRYLNRRGLRIVHTLERIGAELGVEPATVALSWLLSRPRVVAPVVSVSGPLQLEAIMAAPRTPSAGIISPSSTASATSAPATARAAGTGRGRSRRPAAPG